MSLPLPKNITVQTEEKQFSLTSQETISLLKNIVLSNNSHSYLCNFKEDFLSKKAKESFLESSNLITSAIKNIFDNSLFNDTSKMMEDLSITHSNLLKEVNDLEYFNISLNEIKTPLFLVFKLLNLIQPNNSMDLEGNLENNYKYRLNVISNITIHIDFIKEALVELDLEHKTIIAHYLSILNVYDYTKEELFSKEDQAFFDKKIKKELDLQQKLNFLIFSQRFLYESVFKFSITNLVKQSLTAKDDLYFEFVKLYQKDMDKFSLYNLNDFISLYYHHKHYENNIFINGDVNPKVVFSKGKNGYEQSLVLFEKFNEAVTKLEKNTNLVSYLLENEIKNVSKFSLQEEIKIHAEEFFLYHQEFFQKKLMVMKPQERLFFLDMIEFLSSQGNKSSVSLFYKLGNDQFHQKWSYLNKIFKENKYIHSYLVNLFNLLQALNNQKALDVNTTGSLNFIIQLLIPHFKNLSIVSKDKEKNKEFENLILSSDFSSEDILNLVQSITSFGNLIENDALYSIFDFIYQSKINLKQNMESLFKLYVNSLINEDFKLFNLNFINQEVYESNKNKKHKKDGFNFKINDKVHYLVPDLTKALNTLLTNARHEEDYHDKQNTISNVVNFLEDLVAQKFVKSYVYSSKEVEDRLFKLKESFSNFNDVIDFYISQFRLGKQVDQIKPVLLLGDNGIGKTKFINELSKALDIRNEFINCPLISSKFTLTGIHRSYKSAKAGLIFNTCLESETGNALFLFDEIDKTHANSHIIEVLFSLLEKESAKKFKDDYVGYEIDTSGSIIVATANDLSEVNKGLLSRFEMFKINMPSKEKVYELMDAFWKEIQTNNPSLPKKLSFELKQEIINHNLREIHALINKIANKMILNNNEITIEDVYNLVKEQRQINLEIGAENFTILNPKEINVTLNDVRGSEEAKMQIKELIHLFTSEKLNEVGIDKPKGLILYGPAGVGKTMLAKAFAQQVNMPFIALSGSSFVEKYVGVGAQRVRNLFEKARQFQPCIIYIDEMDALGKRGSDQNSERDATINEFLVQLDGAKNNEGIFVIGSTNYLENLDQALIRSGRFDRKIQIELPYLEERKDLICHLLNTYKVEEQFDVNQVAKMTHDYSPADIKNLFNQAGIIAIRNDRNYISLEDLRLADEELTLGIKKTLKETDKNKLITAYHESGHAVLGHILEHSMPVRRVTITPRANSLGVTYSYPEDDFTNMSKDYMLDHICMTLGGRAAEQIFIKQISTGASGDIKQVTKMANSMITKYGFAEDDYLSMVLYDDLSKLSDKTREKIEQEVLKIVKTQYDRALFLLEENKDFVEAMTKMLMEKEVINEEDIYLLYEQTKKI